MVRLGVAAPAALPLFLLFLLLPLLFLVAGFAVGHALGFSPVVTVLLFYAILAGSAFNIPIYERDVQAAPHPRTVNVLGVEYRLPHWSAQRAVVAVNVGGCLVPLAVSVYFLFNIPPAPTLVATVAVAAACYLLARPLPQVGIALPALVPVVVTVVAALASCLLLGGMPHLARVSFTAGVVGTIVGADILHLRNVSMTRATVVSIGGAGTFDGIFLTGVFATLLSTLVS